MASKCPPINWPERQKALVYLLRATLASKRHLKKPCWQGTGTGGDVLQKAPGRSRRYPWVSMWNFRRPTLVLALSSSSISASGPALASRCRKPDPAQWPPILRSDYLKMTTIWHALTYHHFAISPSAGVSYRLHEVARSKLACLELSKMQLGKKEKAQQNLFTCYAK